MITFSNSLTIKENIKEINVMHISCLIYYIKRHVRKFHIVLVLWTSKNCTKKGDAELLKKPIIILMFSLLPLSQLLKLSFTTISGHQLSYLADHPPDLYNGLLKIWTLGLLPLVCVCVCTCNVTLI